MRVLLAALVVAFLLTGCAQRVSSAPSLVAVTATWCQPCQRDKPLLAEVKKEFSVVEYDDKSPMTKALGVSSYPTYIVMEAETEYARTGDLRTALRWLHYLNQLRQ